jgi:uncharacterized protein
VLRLLILWLALAWAAPAVWAQDVRALPAPTARVIDETGTLTPDQQAALEARLAAFEAEAGPQIVVLLVPSTQPEDIADFTQRLGETWKIGRRDVGDGVLLVVAKDDRRVRIAPAKALEGAIPDLVARQIIDRTIAPAFRAGDYAGGVDAALEQLIARIRGEALPEPAKKPAAGDAGWQVEDLLMFFFIAVPVIGSVMTGILGRKLGTLATSGISGGIAWVLTASLLLAAGAVLASVLLVGLFGVGSAARNIARAGRRRGGPPVIFGPGGDHGGWGGGGFGGGGFSSGGGGDFGGGGASGDW